MLPKHTGLKKCLIEDVFTLCFIELYIATPRNQNPELSIFFLISINEKHSLKSVIENAEYEIGAHQNFFYMIAALHHCSKSQKNTFGGVYCFVKLHPRRQTESFQRRQEVCVKSHRLRIVVEKTSCAHVDNSDL